MWHWHIQQSAIENLIWNASEFSAGLQEEMGVGSNLS